MTDSHAFGATLGPLTEPAPPSWREWGSAIVVATALLVLLRPVTVNEPYWWDASAVYVPGAHWLETHHFAARPGVFPSDLSRGHTPLFYLALAFAFRFFGTSPVVGHTLVLACAIASIVLTYGLGRLVAGPLAGACAALLVAGSNLFLTMSSEALPEIPCTALTMAVLYTFARGRYAACAAWGCALVLAKELTVAGSAACAGALLLTALRHRTVHRDLRAIAILSVPAVPLAVFFAWQRIAEGWFITPYHASLFNTPHSYLESFVYVVRSLFATDAQWLVTVPALAALSARHRAGNATPHPSPPSSGTVRLALALLVLANIVFYTRGWFLDRYALPAHPAVAILAAHALTQLANARSRRHGATVLVAGTLAACFAAAIHRESGKGYDSGETTFRYVHAIRAQKRVFDRLASRGGDPIVMTTWPMTDELRWPYLGYVTRPFRVVNADYLDPSAPPARVDAVVVFDGVGSARGLREEATRRGFRVIARERVGGATCEWWGAE
jgi:4-amino-4-deoxy-L-arabinose transferase-like glycosyltransferase